MSLRYSRRTTAAVAAPLLALAAAASVSAAPVSFGNSSYDLVLNEQLSWNAAQTAAQSAGGHLATITSAEEQAFIESLLTDRDAPTGSYWFGLTETATEGQFASINGEQSSFTDFAPGEPNNGLHFDENSGSIYWTSDADAELSTFARRGQWNDVPEAGYPNPVSGNQTLRDLLRAGFLVEFADGGNGGGNGDGGGIGGDGGDGDGAGVGGGGGTGGSGGGGIGGDGDGGGIGGDGSGANGGGVGAGGEPNPIPVPPAVLAFPGAAALAYWASRRMRKGI